MKRRIRIAMKRSNTHYIIVALMLTVVGTTMTQVSAAILDVLPGTNNTTITKVVYTQSWDNQQVTQTQEATQINSQRDEAIYVDQVEVDLGSETKLLDVFNFEGAEVRNINFIPSSKRAVGVFTNGTVTDSSDLAAFSDAVVGTTQDTNLMNYLYYDNSKDLPDANTADFDLLFRFGFTSDDHILVSERWGNTFFELTPLGADGDVIAGANKLRFGYPTGGAFTKYDWRTGYASASYQSGQDQAFTVASVTKFFEGTTITDPVDQIVYGFRIDNNGQADVKFLGLSDNTFTNNPENPLLSGGAGTQIPSPAAAWIGISLVAGAVLRRKRK